MQKEIIIIEDRAVYIMAIEAVTFANTGIHEHEHGIGSDISKCDYRIEPPINTISAQRLLPIVENVIFKSKKEDANKSVKIYERTKRRLERHLL